MKISTQKQKTEGYAVFKRAGIFSASLIVAASAIYLYSPTFGSHAEDSVNVSVGATINPVASLTLDTSNVAFTFTPTAAGVFESKTINATVDTNSTGGYELYFSSEDNSTNMTSNVPSIENVIASDFDGTVTSSTMAANKWGYSLDNTDFSKIPSASDQATIKNIDHFPSASEKTTAVNVGIKVDTSLPSGTYSKNVVFSVIAHETPVPPVPMQSFDESIIPNVGDTARVEDLRDGSIYNVKRLADGKVWMTDNLRLINKTITSADSNVTADFTIPASDINAFDTETNTNAAYYNSTGGGFYSFYTASAGTGGTSLTSGNTSSDICPKGWRLPTGGSGSEYNTMFAAYSRDGELIKSEANFVLVGYQYYNNIENVGKSANYATSTIKDADNVYLAEFYTNGGPTTYANALNYNYKYYGANVRCVVK